MIQPLLYRLNHRQQQMVRFFSMMVFPHAKHLEELKNYQSTKLEYQHISNNVWLDLALY